MTGDAIAGNGHLQENRILIAIDPHFRDIQRIAAAFAFLPKFFSRAAPEPGRTGSDCAGEGLFVHIGEHQDLAGRGVTSNAGDGALFVEFRGEFVAFFDLFDR